MSKVRSALRKKKKEEEKKLIKRALQKDNKAFAELYKRYHGQVYGFCARLLHGKYDVDDVVQNVFFEAWRSMASFEGRSMFSTWLTKIAIHTCLSFHRRKSRLVFSVFDDSDIYEQATVLMWVEHQAIPDEKLLIDEKQKAINKLVTRMAPKKKLVFMLSDVHGMTASEIGDILNIPDATVRTRLFHARKEFVYRMKKNENYLNLLTPNNFQGF